MPKPTGSPPLVRHREFRNFDNVRAALNDAAMGLIVGNQIARLHVESLRTEQDRDPTLDELYASSVVPEVRRFNFRLSRAEVELKDAEGTLGLMALPVAVALYNEYLVAAIRLLELGGAPAPSRPAEKSMLGELRDHLSTRAGITLSPIEDGLFDIVAKMRNRIVHWGGVVGEDLQSSWAGLPGVARQEWQRLAGRPLRLPAVGDRLHLEAPEIRAVFALVGNLAKVLNSQLQGALARSFWADVAVQDFYEERPELALQTRQRLRPLKVFVDSYYAPLCLGPGDLHSAVARAPFTGLLPDLRPYPRVSPTSGVQRLKPVTSKDRRSGRLRVPPAAQALLPAAPGKIAIRIRGQDLICGYSPRTRANPPRSGVIDVGSDVLSNLVVVGQEPQIFSVGTNRWGVE